MATHTPAQAIQELVNHTAVLTERLVGLQTEVRKGMNMTPEWGNALTQVVGDTKRMLMAMEHLARLPAFHLDREGLNAAVAAGVQQGLSGEGGNSLINMIEVNSKNLDDARTELTEAKLRMDKLLEEMQSARIMTPENRQKFFMQFAPVVGMWSVGLLIAGLIVGRSCAAPQVVQQQVPPAIAGQQTEATPTPVTANPPVTATPRPATGGVQQGTQMVMSVSAPIYPGPSSNGRAQFNAPVGMRVTVLEVRGDGWVRIGFSTSAQNPEQRGSGWLAPGVLK